MIDLDAEPPQRERQQQHEEEFRHLPERLNERRLRNLDLVEERIRERVVELQRNAEQERADDEDQEVAVAEQLKRVEAERVAHVERRARRFGRRVRQRERVGRHDDRRAGRDLHRQHERVGVKHFADDDARDDPADRSEHADDRKVARRVRDVVERDRVRERQRRHVAQRVQRSAADRTSRTSSASRRAHINTPPSRCSSASSFSLEKKRSATMPMKKGDTSAAIAVAP